jgi:ATP-dependent exoDNAse (exonuclease V) alpha subunit
MHRHSESQGVQRILFPLKLAYTITINRSQGQSIDYILLDVCKDVFIHGQAYVALSRIRRNDRIIFQDLENLSLLFIT